MKTKSQPEKHDILATQEVESIERQDGHQDLQIRFDTLDIALQQPVSKIYQSWKQLFENDPNSNIYQNPDHLVHCISDLQESHTGQSGYLMLCIQNEKTIAAGILLPKSHNSKCLRKLGLTRFFQGYYLCGNRFLIDPEFEEDETLQNDLLKSLLSFCQNQKAAFLLLDDLLLDQPLNRSIPGINDGFLSFSQSGYQNRNLIHFTDNPADYWNQFRSKSRTKHRRRLRQNSEMHLVRITEPDQVVEFLENAHQISVNTWQTQRFGLRIKNAQSELDELTSLAINNQLRSYLLMKGDQPVAFKLGYQHKGTFRDLEFGFDLNYAQTSPGEALLLLIFEDLIQHNTPAIYDFGEGDGEYKQRYSSEITQSRSLMLLPPTLKNRCLLSYLYTSRSMSQLLRKTLKATGIHTAVRQIFRYGKIGSK
ncbi:GNAT family N-acetyltransferase [uncultured Gimesia sp.]|mgnify:CR=1 FL=1|uniref:GNAT family N-acetyltransferase n=1 Tax=uncultured Gimesia sp. TaxID=1678688 RepID=UPI0026135A8B|nr:GNAT family N-acetyltransferase [uncultured Gimesia sp.]